MFDDFSNQTSTRLIFFTMYELLTNFAPIFSAEARETRLCNFAFEFNVLVSYTECHIRINAGPSFHLQTYIKLQIKLLLRHFLIV